MKLWHGGDNVSLSLQSVSSDVQHLVFSRRCFGRSSVSAAKLRRILVLGKRFGKDSCFTFSSLSFLGPKGCLCNECYTASVTIATLGV